MTVRASGKEGQTKPTSIMRKGSREFQNSRTRNDGREGKGAEATQGDPGVASPDVV